MADVRGSNVIICAAPETTYKTPGANSVRLNVISFGVKVAQPRNQSQTLSGFRGQARGTDGARDVSGPINAEIAPQSIGFLLKNLVGAPTTSGAAAPYTHTFKAAASGANALPVGLTFEQDFGTAIASASRFLRFHGCRFGSGAFTFSTNAAPTLQIDAQGATWSQAAAAIDASPTDTGHTAFSITELAIRLGPSATPKNICLNSLTLNWSNDLDTDKYCLNDGGVRDGLPEGFAIVGGSVTAFFDHEDVINTMLSGSDTEMLITLTRGSGDGSSGNEKLTITIPALTFERTSPTVEGPKGLRMSANFTAHRTTGELGVEFVLLSPQATID